jgi:hypothetical protein
MSTAVENRARHFSKANFIFATAITVSGWARAYRP